MRACKEILVIVIFSIIVPSVDSISDITLGIRFLLNGRPWWALSVLSPVLANTLFTALLWTRLEVSAVKRWSWVLVLLQVWPQYCAARVVWLFYSGRHNAIREKEQFERGIISLEPFIESVPQVLILCNIYLKTSVIGTSINKAEVEEDTDILAGTRWIFFTTLAFSVMSASLGITKFFKVGPIRFLPHDHLVTVKFLLALTASATFLLYKGVTLATMIYSASATMPHLLAQHNNSLLAQLPSCTSITMVKKYPGTWHNLRHIHLAITSLTATWSTSPVFSPPGTDWVYLYDPGSGQMVTQNGSVERCLQDLQSCRPSIYSEGEFYCIDVTWLGALLWIFILVFPVLLLNLIVLGGTFQGKLVHTLSLFPPLIFSGNFSLFLFGPTDPSCSWFCSCCIPRKERKLSLSLGLTWVNIALSLIQAALALILLNKMKGPVHESHDPQFQISSSNPVTVALQMLLLTFLIISIVLTVLVLHLDLITYYSCPAELGVLDGCRPDTQLILTARGLEEVAGSPIIPSQDMEMEEICPGPISRKGQERIPSATVIVTSKF
eukprot:GFUD01009939.1.p1 GENE.GFUD01009939.1~~GFUD01009939.1.p1  ORF type:complete len:552 (-),score=107.03 GFUD01009939.1:142-1797(-)